jgi:hypothetical protein
MISSDGLVLRPTRPPLSNKVYDGHELPADGSHAMAGARIMPWKQRAIRNNKCF